MRIQNPALAGVTLALRYHPGQTATGDAHGTFDVPDADAEFLLSTSGWRPFDAVRQAQADAVLQQHEAARQASRDHEAVLQAQRLAQIAAEAAKAAPVVVKADEKAASNAYEAAKALEQQVTSAPSANEPNLAAMDRAALIATAEGYGVGIDRRWSEQRIRETLHAALFDDETKG